MGEHARPSSSGNEPASIKHQVTRNVVAIISLLFAMSALGYNTWRNERTERNRTTRAAAFEVLKALDQLQIVVNYAYYESESPLGNPMTGWGYMALASDLSQLLPEPAPEATESLLKTWRANWQQVRKDEASVDLITKDIDESREAVLSVLRRLD